MAGVEEELASLKEAYPEHCRMVSGLGDCAHGVTFKPGPENFHIKFQLSDSYPDEVPLILVRAAPFDEKGQKNLHTVLAELARISVGKPMLLSLFKEACDWLDTHQVDVTSDASLSPRVGSPRRQKKQKQKTLEEEETTNQKLVSMRTAEEVIQRVLWDEILEKEDFIIGYLDRFLGVIEQDFSAFSWEDISSVDNNTLAIPRHRIHYFKYKGEKVWDKNERMDNFFGSTGSNITIRDVALRLKDQGTKEQIAAAAAQVEKEADADSDDDVQVTIGQVKVRQVHRQETKRPNFFLCLRITDPDIVQAAAAIQDTILDAHTNFQGHHIPATAYHITLCVLKLDSPTHVANCTRALENSRETLLNLTKNPIELNIKGVGQFGNRVLYAKVDCDERLLAFGREVRQVMTKAGFAGQDAHDFVPHMTLIKTSAREVDDSLCERFAEVEFGRQVVDSVHLCDMDKAKMNDEFYEVPFTMNLEP